MLTLSHTDIANYLQCKRRWYWSYLLSYNPPEKLTGALAIGSRVHAGIQAGYEGGDMLEAYEVFAQRDIALVEQSDSSWDLDKIYEDIVVGRNCIVAYQDWLEETGEDQGLIVDGVEDEIEAIVLDGQVRLRGKVDVRFQRESDGALILEDLKTTGLNFGNLREELERSYQHRIYIMIQRVMEENNGEAARPIGGAGYRMIKKVTKRQRGKTMVERFGVPGVLRAEHMARIHIEGICRDIITTIDRLSGGQTYEDSESVVYPTPSEACLWCGLKTPCSMFDESPIAAQEMLDDHFHRGRHDRYSS